MALPVFTLSAPALSLVKVFARDVKVGDTLTVSGQNFNVKRIVGSTRSQISLDTDAGVVTFQSHRNVNVNR